MTQTGWTPLHDTVMHKKLTSQWNNIGERVKLDSLPRISAYVFPNPRTGKPLTTIRKSLQTAARKAKLTDRGKSVKLTVHDLRRINASWRAMAGVPERVLQDLLGHAPGTPVTNQHYVFTTDEAKRNAVISLRQ